MVKPETKYGYDPGDTWVSRTFDQVFSARIRVGLPLAAFAIILARGESGENSLPQENYMLPENGIIASPVAASPATPELFLLPEPETEGSVADNGEAVGTSTAEALDDN